MKAEISVIIPTMNRPQSLKRTIEGFAKGDVIPREIVIVDQSDKEETRRANKEVLNSFGDVFDSVIYEYQPTPSLTKARNTGLSKANNDILINSDDDIDVNSDTVKNVANLMSIPNMAMIAGIDELTSCSKSNIGYLLGTKSFRKRKIGHVTSSMLGRYPDNISKQTPTQWAMGYFFVVRKSLCQRWNCAWDENLTGYAYSEDLDFSFNYYRHAATENLECILDPGVKVKHLATLEYRIPGVKNLYMYVINREYLRHKHTPGLYSWISCQWCNLWRLIEHTVRRQHPVGFAKAILQSVRYHRLIHSGILDYDLFMGQKNV